MKIQIWNFEKKTILKKKNLKKNCFFLFFFQNFLEKNIGSNGYYEFKFSNFQIFKSNGYLKIWKFKFEILKKKQFWKKKIWKKTVFFCFFFKIFSKKTLGVTVIMNSNFQIFKFSKVTVIWKFENSNLKFWKKPILKKKFLKKTPRKLWE